MSSGCSPSGAAEHCANETVANMTAPGSAAVTETQRVAELMQHRSAWKQFALLDELLRRRAVIRDDDDLEHGPKYLDHSRWK